MSEEVEMMEDKEEKKTEMAEEVEAGDDKKEDETEMAEHEEEKEEKAEEVEAEKEEYKEEETEMNEEREVSEYYSKEEVDAKFSELYDMIAEIKTADVAVEAEEEASVQMSAQPKSRISIMAEKLQKYGSHKNEKK